MTLVARLFKEGSEEVTTVDRLEDIGQVPDHSLLWVDTSLDEESASRLEGLDLAEAARDVIEARRRDIAFYGDTIRLSVTAVQGEPDRPAPARLALLLARNVVISMHDVPILGLDDQAAEDPDGA